MEEHTEMAVKSRVKIHLEMAAKMNFARQQNAYPVIRDFQLENLDAERAVENLTVTVSSSPAFVRERIWRVDRIEAAGTVDIGGDADVTLEGGVLWDLREMMRGVVDVVVRRGDEVVAAHSQEVELLAYNEWGGVSYMPEILAAFSLPNDPAVSRVLHDAGAILRQAGKPDGINGYTEGTPTRVWEMASAIYAAICRLGIHYVLPPASFEKNGQKIRLPSEMVAQKVATCLDTTLLFAAAFEQAGLNAVVALPKGHAVVGVWLQNEDLADIAIDEAEILRKRIQSRELILIETTCVTQSPAPKFSEAIRAAVDAIAPDKDEGFCAAVDIRRARVGGIRPLSKSAEAPSGDGGDGDGGDARVEASEVTFEEAPADLPSENYEGVAEERPKTPEGRLARWQRKLLDLSARNPLLNHKSATAGMPLICPRPGDLEDRLAGGDKFTVSPLPVDNSSAEEKRPQRRREDITEEYALDALNKKQILTELTPEDLDKRSVALYRKAQTALQEGGSNTLYLALGFLLWRAEGGGKHLRAPNRAPLILLPVALERKTARTPIRIVAHDDEARFNTTLLEMLRQDFRIDIPGLDGALPEDESGIDVEGVWETVRRHIVETKGLEVVGDVVLGHFSFAKYLMWKDLVDRAELLKENAVVRHIMESPDRAFGGAGGGVCSQDVDEQYPPRELLLPLPADASQTAAVATAHEGENFIVIGPPGTGKSQTIENMISHFLGTNKSVLFVSEKTAALEVVHRRLKGIGLGDFCLELHSNKANKAEVARKFGRVLEEATKDETAGWERMAEALQEERAGLNAYVRQLHAPRANGITAYRAMGVGIRDAAAARGVKFAWEAASVHSEARLEEMRRIARELGVCAEEVGEDLGRRSLQFVARSDWSNEWQAQTVGKGRR